MTSTRVTSVLAFVTFWSIATNFVIAGGINSPHRKSHRKQLLGLTKPGPPPTGPNNEPEASNLSGNLSNDMDVDFNMSLDFRNLTSDMMSNLPWVARDDIGNLFLASLFTLALLLVAFEDVVKINKAAVIMLTAATMWAFSACAETEGRRFQEDMQTSLGNVGQMLIFLLAAMGIVESIAHFGGFNVVVRAINFLTHEAPWRLMPIICACTFMLSAFIDNFTSTIVALKVLGITLKYEHDFRRSCGSLAVIAANSGGAWSPMGDVTTTMLWMADKVTAFEICKNLILPAFVSVAVPYFFISQLTELPSLPPPNPQFNTPRWSATRGYPKSKKAELWELGVLIFGILCMLLAPFLKLTIDLPPYMSTLMGLGFFWVIMDISSWLCPQHHEGSEGEGVPAALSKLDLSTLLFFGGVLFAVGALEHAGLLKLLTEKLVSTVGLEPLKLSFVMGITSSAIDNVPLVDASIGMFANMASVDDPLWMLIALAAGTGGSILIIGSAAGLVFMGQENVSFLWYVTNTTPWAFIGYCSGLVTYAHDGFLAVVLVIVCAVIHASWMIHASRRKQAETARSAQTQKHAD